MDAVTRIGVSLEPDLLKDFDELISKTQQAYKDVMTEKDNIDPAIAAHWGPNAFGYIFVEK